MLTVIGFIEQENWMYAYDFNEHPGFRNKAIAPVISDVGSGFVFTKVSDIEAISILKASIYDQYSILEDRICSEYF